MYDPVPKQVSVSRDMTFSERVGETAATLEESQDEVVLPKSSAEEDDENIHQEIEVIPHNGDHHQQNAVDEREASTRSQQKATQGTPRAFRNRSEIKKPVRYEMDLAEYVVPNTYEEAVNGKDAVQWAQAIEEDLIAHEINHTCLIVPRTPARKNFTLTQNGYLK